MRLLSRMMLAFLAFLMVACAVPTPATAPEAAAPAADSAAAAEPMEITFYSYNLGAAGTFSDGAQKLLDTFAATQSNVKVNGVGVPGGEILAKTQADLVAGTPPDIAQLIFDDLDNIVTNFNAVPLEDFVPAEELAEHLAGMHPNGVKLGQLNGKTYGLAYTFSTPMLFYNGDLFTAAGLDPNAPPKNWEEVLQYGQQINEATGAAGIYVAATGRYDWITQSLYLSAGGRAMSEDRTQVMVGEEGSVRAVTMLRELVQAGVMPNMTSPETVEAMAAGKLAMLVNSSALQATLLKAAEGNYDLRSAPLPGFGDQLAVPTNSGSAIFVLTQDPERQKAAWEFMKFATSKEGYTIITRDIGYLPLRPEIVTEEAYLKAWVEEHPLILPNIEQLDRLQPWTSFPGPNYRQIIEITQTAVEQAIFGDNDDVAGIMMEAQERAQELMPQ
jgi:multiple sugar transport system substrate-binding protein